MLQCDNDTLCRLVEAFRFDGVPRRLTPISRGGNGQVWRLDLDQPRRSFAVKELFADDATMTADGGGKAIAVIRILHGAARIARLWYAVARRRTREFERRFVRVNGQLGIANYVRGRLHSVSTIDTDGKRIYAYYSIANPDKLGAYLEHVGDMAVTNGGARASGG